MAGMHRARESAIKGGCIQRNFPKMNYTGVDPLPGNLPLFSSLFLPLSLFNRNALCAATVFVCITKSPCHGRIVASDRGICKFWVEPGQLTHT